MPIKVLSYDAVESGEVPEFVNPLSFATSRLAEIEGVLPIDADGGRMVAGSAADGSATLTYFAADGTSTLLENALPDEGAEFTDGTVVPVGGAAGTYLFEFRGAPTDAGPTLINVGVVTLDENGTPAVSTLEGTQYTSTDEFGSNIVEVQAMADGRVAILNYVGEGDEVQYNVVEIVSLVGDDLTFTQLPVSYTGGQIVGGVMALADGGTLLVSQNASITGAEGSLSIRQFDADGLQVSGEALTTEQIEGLGISGSDAEFRFALSPDGELEAYVFRDTGDGAGPQSAVRVVYDLIPEQSDAPGLVLPEIEEGDYIDGTDGDDSVTGTDGSDYFNVGDGDDIVIGRGGFDYIDFDAGNNLAYGGGGGDYMTASDGDNVFYGGDGDDYLTVGTGDNVLYAGVGDDGINARGGSTDGRGGNGNDAIYGGEDDDFLRGNHDNDVMSGGDGADNMNGGFGDDDVRGGAGDDKVSGFDGADDLYGDGGADRMHGGIGDDMLFGGDGDDILRGADGDDTLSGDAGDDLLIGGAGADVFSFDMIGPQNVQIIDFDDEGPDGDELIIEDPTTLDTGMDTIKDFVIGEDKIALDASYLVADADDPQATATQTDLTFDDLFLSQEDSFAVISLNDTTIRLKGVDVEDLSEDDFVLL